MPLIMTILSAIYFVYVMSGEDTILTADAVGGDPGGKLLPLIMSVFMFVGFLYLTWKERPTQKNVNPETRRLFLITLAMALLYVLLIRHVGFVILSAMMLFGLEYIYNTAGDQTNGKHMVYGVLGTTAGTVVFYLIMRFITRSLMSMGRNGILPGIFTVTAFEAGISLVYVFLVTVVLHKTVCRKMRVKGLKNLADSGLLTIATVLFLYVVFKQFFSVNLATGLLNF